ncbi:PLP-dependent aminotransferase family protein [Pseudofrankia sp. DC12]|uniref:MocR-like pyridoxine biosynthesis transcription factor PdxR n=1 Tax=Pseudofrankia sp. DC12 TaxID=683315 RepID=UPI0005F815AB|nr:PLP-dependent aminotransferase family protein [Pseudofrankia sp. DC12]
MPDTWATSGFDLHLDLTGPRVRTALEAALRDAVRTGRLVPGTRLPSSRTLAQDLGLARNTVAEAYGQLVGEGWLVARQGSGTRVADRPTRPGPAPGAGRGSAPRANAASIVAAAPRYDLRAGSPDLASFPRASWLAAGRRALLATSSDALGYTSPRGLPQLREALAEYLARARGVRVTADRIVVCAGFAQALALLCQVLRARGATAIATEAFGLTGNADTVTSHGMRPLFLPVDPRGARVGAATGADAVLLTPAHQFPLGQSLSPARRADVVRWAADTGGLVIEDDYDGEFRYDRQPIGALQALAPEHVVYAGTASKTLAPGLRLAWLVLPAPLVAEVAAAKAAADRQCGALEQLTLAEFLARGEYDRHVRRRRLAYRRRRDHLVETLRRAVPQLRIRGIAAGLHAMVELPDGQTEAAALARAARRGLAVGGLGSYNLAGQPHRPALVVGYATPPDHAFTSAIARLAALLAEPTDPGA